MAQVQRLVKFGLATTVALVVLYAFLSTHHRTLIKSSNVFNTVTANIASAAPVNPYTDEYLERLNLKYTKTLVIAKESKDDTTWIDDLNTGADFQTAIYTVDDSHGSLTVPVNKGNEAMVYLTFIIENYHQLPDVSLFMHHHAVSWHNNDLLSHSAARAIESLSAEKVVREGYMNLRCHWEPGCPARMNLAIDKLDDSKEEQQILASAFTQLFPGDRVPSVLAQPCCAQFAVSRESIHRTSAARYVQFRNWLIATDLDNDMSGRIFEYLWQYIFTSAPVNCPDMHICYCDGFSVCFPTSHAYDQYFDIQDTAAAFREELDEWSKEVDVYRKVLQGGHEAVALQPEPGRGEWLGTHINDLHAEMERRKKVALELGADPVAKAEVLRKAWKELDKHPKETG